MFDFNLFSLTQMDHHQFVVATILWYSLKKITNTHIKVLENNDWIVDCVGPQGSLLLLAVKPHEEECKGIKKFIQNLCVSCRPLKSVTHTFEFPISRCTDDIEYFGDSSGHIYFISLDT